MNKSTFILEWTPSVPFKVNALLRLIFWMIRDGPQIGLSVGELAVISLRAFTLPHVVLAELRFVANIFKFLFSVYRQSTAMPAYLKF